MATTKKNENKSASAKKHSATTTKKGATQQPGTRVVCPNCGTEFDVLAQHEHQAKNVTVIGADSGLGTIYLPVSKQGEALKAAGLNVDNYFSVTLPTGGKQWMKMEGGKAVVADNDDPIVQAIIAGGTVPNRNLFRRWVMSQVFHGLLYKGYHGEGFTAWMKCRGYQYQWEMLIEELHVQAKLYGKDAENFYARNRWFNKKLAAKMASDYASQLRQDALSRKQHHCKGIPYVKVAHVNYFLDDVDKKLVWPMHQLAHNIAMAKTPADLEKAVRTFWKKAPVKSWDYTQCAEWKDAYKGMGAYATMQNLLRFHGCTFPKDNDFYERRLSGLKMLENAAENYKDGEGWRLFGLMKQMIEENHIDIVGKMEEWTLAKQAKKIK